MNCTGRKNIYTLIFLTFYLFVNAQDFNLQNNVPTCSEAQSRAATTGREQQFYNLLRAGIASKESDRLKTAVDQFYEALKLAEELRDKAKIAYVYSKLANCNFSSGELKASLAYNRKALALYQQLNCSEGIAVLHHAIGADYFAMNKVSLCVAYYLKNKSYLSQLPQNINTSQVYIAIAAAYRLCDQYDSAHKYADIGYRIACRTGSKAAIVSAMSTLSSIYFYSGNLRMALKTGNEALAILNTIHFTLQVSDLALLLKKINIQAGDYKEALRVYELYINARDTLTNNTNRRLALEKEFNYNLEKKESENKLLAQQYKIQSLELEQKDYLLLGLGAVVVLIAVIAYLLIRQNRLRADQKNMQLEHRLLRSQMNPHFMFNSLQAIQTFILTEDRRQAESYLGSFASLMRSVLENSRLESISLKKEIALLENYMRLQKLRFGNRFTYEIITGDSVNVEDLSIPPMLAQPFVENAIEHGFHGNNNDGRIVIFYAVQNDKLTMEVTDNGAGLKSKPSSGKTHQSLAISITKERIALLNRKAKNNAFFSIEEAFPVEPERKGVKVTFHLPLN